jgi:hypothetical protein
LLATSGRHCDPVIGITPFQGDFALEWIFAMPIVIQVFDTAPKITAYTAYTIMTREECSGHMHEIAKRYRKPGGDGRQPLQTIIHCQWVTQQDLMHLSDQISLKQMKP